MEKIYCTPRCRELADIVNTSTVDKKICVKISAFEPLM
jgi:hypothetical protein